MKDLVIFDFCETLIQYQTADRYINYILSDTTINRNSFWTLTSRLLGNRYLVMVSNKFFPHYNYGKRIRLLSLRGVKTIDIERSSKAFNKIVQKSLIRPLYNKMNQHIKNKDHVIIVSGGYDSYIQYFAKEFGVEAVFATKIKMNNNYCTGIFDGEDCMFDKKLKIVKEYINENELQCKNSIFYTDSISDLILMQWVDQGIVVSKENPQAWSKEYGFKEILWKSY